jgi:hypothetical protein
MTALTVEPESATLTPAPSREVDTALARIEEAIAGLRKLANLVTDRPEVADAVNSGLDCERSLRVLLYASDRRAGDASVPAYIADLATAASNHGADVSMRHDSNYGGINAQFGFVTLYVYADLDAVGSIATRTHSVQVTDWQPDPALSGIPAA